MLIKLRGGFIFNGVIFDFNGTLFWDTEIHNLAWDIFLKQHKIYLSDDDKNKKIHGQNNSNIMNNIFNSKISYNEITKYIDEKESIYRKLCKESNLELADGAIEFFEFLKAKKIKFTIATASIWDNLKFYFEKLNLHKWFDINKVVYDNGKNKSKPSGDFFIKAAKNIDLEPIKTIVFEDSYNGIMAAENANVGKIIIVDSCNIDYQNWKYIKIKSFSEVDKDYF